MRVYSRLGWPGIDEQLLEINRRGLFFTKLTEAAAADYDDDDDDDE